MWTRHCFSSGTSSTFVSDLRVYVLVTSYEPLRIYVFREGLVRFASQKYGSGSEHVFAHLTNYSINKKASNFVQSDGTDDDSGFKWSFASFHAHLAEQGVDLAILWSKIYDVIVKSLLSIEAGIRT